MPRVSLSLYLDLDLYRYRTLGNVPTLIGLHDDQCITYDAPIEGHTTVIAKHQPIIVNHSCLKVIANCHRLKVIVYSR